MLGITFHVGLCSVTSQGPESVRPVPYIRYVATCLDIESRLSPRHQRRPVCPSSGIMDLSVRSRRSAGLRKAHRKSRGGCQQCKRRHVKVGNGCKDRKRFSRSCTLRNLQTDKRLVKCDETHMRCSECSRLELECSFTVAASPASSASPLHTSEPTQDGLDSGLVSPDDLVLLHNYMTSTVNSFDVAVDDELRTMFTHEYVRTALAEPFLLHTLLGVSAMHLFSKDPSKTEYFRRATLLQNTALRLVQPHLTHLAEEHAIALFIFSSFTAAFAFAKTILDPYNEPQDPVMEMRGCFGLLRGTSAVIGPHITYLRSSWLQPAFRAHCDKVLDNSEVDHPAYSTVCEMIQRDERDGYAQLLPGIRRLFMYLLMLGSTSSGAQGTMFVHSWPAEVDKAFIDMLDERRPTALVIMAYYAVLMSLNSKAWWIGNWPDLLLTRIDRELGHDYAAVLEWPRRMIPQRFTTSSSQVFEEAAH